MNLDYEIDPLTAIYSKHGGCKKAVIGLLKLHAFALPWNDVFCEVKSFLQHVNIEDHDLCWSTRC